MSATANPARGEASLTIGGRTILLRPSFAALVAAEAALGPLFGLVERAAAGELKIGEVAELVWHCIAERAEGLRVEEVGEALAELGLARVAPILKTLLTQILHGASTRSA